MNPLFEVVCRIVLNVLHMHVPSPRAEARVSLHFLHSLSVIKSVHIASKATLEPKPL